MTAKFSQNFCSLGRLVVRKSKFADFEAGERPGMGVARFGLDWCANQMSQPLGDENLINVYW